MEKYITITNPANNLKSHAPLNSFISQKLLNVLDAHTANMMMLNIVKFFDDMINKHSAEPVLSYFDEFKGEYKMQNHQVINNLLGVVASLLTDYISGGGEAKLIEEGALGLISLATGFLNKPASAPVNAAQ